jgi:hypothetical protein
MKLIKINSMRHLSRIFCALVIALMINYYIKSPETGWLLFSTVAVMLTSTGSALYQGLLRFFLLTCVVVIGSLIFSSIHLLYMRMYSVALGALIGMLANIIILPDRVDVECRNAFIPILKSYNAYFSALVIFLLEKNATHAEREKINVEKNLQKLPVWVYETGFDLSLQKGYRYFFIRVEQMSEILFAMHHLVRHSFSENVLSVIREPLLQCVLRVEQFIAALITVLELKKLSEGIIDFGEELAAIEDKLKAIVPPMQEAFEEATDSVYLAEFVYCLRDLRNVLLKMTEALRNKS